MSKFCMGNFGAVTTASEAEASGVESSDYWRYYLIQLYGADIINRVNPTKIYKYTKTGFITIKYTSYSDEDQAKLEALRMKIVAILRTTWPSARMSRDEHIRLQYDKYWNPDKYDTYIPGKIKATSNLITTSGNVYNDFSFGVKLPTTTLKSKYTSKEGAEINSEVVSDEQYLKEQSVALAEVETKKSNTLPLLAGAGVLGYFLLKD